VNKYAKVAKQPASDRGASQSPGGGRGSRGGRGRGGGSGSVRSGSGGRGGRKRTEKESDEDDPAPGSRDEYEKDSAVCSDDEEEVLRFVQTSRVHKKLCIYSYDHVKIPEHIYIYEYTYTGMC